MEEADLVWEKRERKRNKRSQHVIHSGIIFRTSEIICAVICVCGLGEGPKKKDLYGMFFFFFFKSTVSSSGFLFVVKPDDCRAQDVAPSETRLKMDSRCVMTLVNLHKCIVNSLCQTIKFIVN